MNKSPLLSIRTLSATMVFVLLLSAVAVTPAFADGETPPPPDEGIVEEAPTEEAPVEEAAPVDQTTSEEAIATDGTSSEVVTTVDETIVEAPVAETTDPTTADLLATLPEGTDLVVLDADGESVPLASEEAAEIIAGSDPIWCPAGVAPIALTGGCSNSYAQLDVLLADFIPTGNGIIWVEWGSTVAGVTIDGADFGIDGWGPAANYSLTIQGGWNGTSGSTALFAANPYTTFSGVGTDFLRIINWVGPVTLKNLVFNSADGNEAVEYHTLWVETAGNIIVDKVTVNDANNLDVGPTEANGAVLDNTSGVGNVTVTNSTFNNNEGFGLVILSHGTVTLKNIYAYSNGFDGLYVNNNDTNAATAGKPVTLTNGNFSDNGQAGLAIVSEGAITVSNITADLNGSYGAKLDNLTLTTATAAPVYVNGVNSFNGNTGGPAYAGLYVESKGLIKISSTTANGNGGSGVWLTNWLSTPFSSGVTISGFVNTNGNGSVGLEIYSTGLITATNLTANNNNFDGAIILNTESTTPKSVLITGTNTFNNNGGRGLFIQSEGSITLNSLTANNNGYDADNEGVVLQNDYDSTKQMAVTLNGYNTFMGNSDTGLEIASYGVITLNNITAVNNGSGIVNNDGSGAILFNNGGTYAKAVAIKGVNLFSDNDWTGLEVYSDGAIALAKTTASDNDDAGVILDNGASPFSSGVTISGYLIVNANDGKGLWLDSTGAVTAANLTTNGNGQEGTQIINTYFGAPKNVTLSGYNTFNGNDYEGLVIQSRGTVLLYNLTANNNGFIGFYGGVLINNGFASALQMAVTLNGVNLFVGNADTGLSVDSFGVITLNNVTALNNGLGTVNGGGSGAYLENISGLFAKAVSIKGTNVFNGNDGVGLSINSAGAITLSKVSADYNGTGGALLVNSWSSTQSNVMISGYGVFNSNGSFGGTGVGLDISSYGAITLANITAQYNYGSGADLDTVGVTVGHAVTLTGTNSFNYNGTVSTVGSGIIVNADGNITVSNLTASYNYFGGADLDNYANWVGNSFATFGSVFVNGFGNFVGNMHSDGLFVWTHGSITVNRVTANGNGDGAGDRGLDLLAGEGAAIGNITITCSSAYGNDDYGIFASAPGTITVKGLVAYGNVTTDENLSAPTVVRTVCP